VSTVEAEFMTNQKADMSDLSEATAASKPADHLRTLHEKDQEKRLIVVLEKASLETVKVGNLHLQFMDSQA